MVACTSRTACAGFAFPLFTTAVSSVKRCGKYHSVPSTLFMLTPENIVSKRSIGVSAPVPFQPWMGPAAARPAPRCPCAAIRFAGEVPTLRA